MEQHAITKAIETIKVTTIAKEDYLVVSVPKLMSQEMRTILLRQINTCLQGLHNRVLIVEEGITLEIFKNKKPWQQKLEKFLNSNLIHRIQSSTPMSKLRELKTRLKNLVLRSQS